VKAVIDFLVGTLSELGELYEIKLQIIQNDGRVSVSVMCQTTGIGECFDVPQ